MSLVRKALKKLGVDFEAFWSWGSKAQNGRHKKLFDAYDKDLKRWNDAQEELGVWIQRHIDDPSLKFNQGHTRWQNKLKRFSQCVQVRLGRIFDAYKKEVTKG